MMTVFKTLITSRDPKGLHFIGLCEATYNKARLDERRAQRLNENGGEFQVGLKELIKRLSATSQFADEEEKSNYGYLSGYRKPVEISDQIDILRSHWPELDPDLALRYMHEVYPTLQLPGWVEGPFAIIRPGFFSDRYGEELVEVLKALVRARKGQFCNYHENHFGPEYLRQSERTLSKLRALVEQQSGSDILISPAQFGIRHRGRSVRRGREVFVVGEYGSGAKDVGTMLLTNPIRLQQSEDLWIDCAGDEFVLDADEFNSAPYFCFNHGKVEFDADLVSNVSDCSGSISEFLPSASPKR